MHVGVKSGFYIEILFSDNGKGIDKTTQERIFEPFFTTKEPGKGTGLGLSTVYGIIKQHKGNIWVRSQPGQGTTFEIFLPRAAGPAMELGRNEDKKIMPRGTETILVVEDEETVRNFVNQVLEEQGYRVLPASSAEEAKMVFKEAEREVTMLLTDVVMPGENGFELYKNLSGLRPSLKVLYMSGYAMDTLIMEGEAGLNIPLLQKPFHPKLLTQKVREILDA
jgi:CheY-like chemotaxis protein